MAKHRRITFQPGTLGRFVKKHGITFKAIPVYPEMICMKQDHPGQKFFILVLTDREGKGLRVPYMQGADVQGLPELESTLENLAADARLYFDYPTPEEYGSAFGEDEEDWEKNFEILESLAERTMEFLGEPAFNELMALVSDEGFELEGDSGWRRRQRTCG